MIPENVDRPATIKLSESVALPVTPNVLDNVVAPVTVANPATIALLDNVAAPVMVVKPEDTLRQQTSFL